MKKKIFLDLRRSWLRRRWFRGANASTGACPPRSRTSSRSRTTRSSRPSVRQKTKSPRWILLSTTSTKLAGRSCTASSSGRSSRPRPSPTRPTTRSSAWWSPPAPRTRTRWSFYQSSTSDLSYFLFYFMKNYLLKTSFQLV